MRNMVFMKLSVFEFNIESTAFVRGAFDPDPAAHGLHLRLGHEQSEALGVGVPMKYLPDLKEVVAVLDQIDPEAVVPDGQNDLIILAGSPQVNFRFSVRVM